MSLFGWRKNSKHAEEPEQEKPAESADKEAVSEGNEAAEEEAAAGEASTVSENETESTVSENEAGSEDAAAPEDNKTVSGQSEEPEEEDEAGDAPQEAEPLPTKEQAMAAEEGEEEPTEAERLYQMGLDGEDNMDYDAAFNLFLAAAKTDYAPAQFRTGLFYETGRGVNTDKAEAISWYRKAADQNYTAALFNLGYLYYNGEGTDKDEETGIRYITQAADKGDSAAIEFLQSMQKMMKRRQAMQKMNERKPFFIRRVRKMEKLYTVKSAFTGLPYVGFDKSDNSFFVTIFTQKEMADEFKKQMDLAGRNVQIEEIVNKFFLSYFGNLYTMGVSCINFTDYKDFYHIYLYELVKRDLSKLPEKQRPVENPKCVRSICLYLQEARRKQEVRVSRDQLLKLDHTMGAQLRNTTFLMPVRMEEKDGKKLPQLVLLNREGSDQRYVPLFTDMAEYNRFRTEENHFDLLKLGIKPLTQLKLPETANQFIVNVNTFRMILPMDYLQKLAGTAAKK
ncbi:MAG: tetratricopeptide repeat protein [Lachnospiraceae bacterium]|jgi:TPR repeat protein